MKQLILLCFFNLLFFNSFCQDEFPEKIYFKLKKKKDYAATINNKMAGYLINLDDSSIVTTSQKRSYGISINGQSTHYSEIDLLTIKQESGSGKRVLWSSIIGITSGGIIGAATYSKPKPSTCSSQFCLGPGVASFGGAGGSAVIGSLLGGASGAILGAVVGSAKHKFSINRKKDNFERMKSYLTRD